MIVSLIVAYGKDYQIGLNNQMLWHISQDFKNFKKITSGHHILMGRKTFESIGKPLPNRTSLVLSQSTFEHTGVNVYTDLEKAINYAKENGEKELFIIGGALIYDLAFDLVDRMYVSEVNYEGEADAYFRTYDQGLWNIKEEKFYEEIKEDEEIISPSWVFKVLEKKS